MYTRIKGVLIAAFLWGSALLASGKQPVIGQEPLPPAPPQSTMEPVPPPPAQPAAGERGLAHDAVPVQPEGAPPQQLPPPPGAQVPPPPNLASEAMPKGLPAGQWVYTAQYGWVWMPQGDSFVSVPPGGGTPVMYVYYPVVGWSWVVAPWIWGCGPMPYFGIYGPLRFTWWGRGFGHWYGFSGAYAHHVWGGGYHHQGHWVELPPAHHAPPALHNHNRDYGWRRDRHSH